MLKKTLLALGITLFASVASAAEPIKIGLYGPFTGGAAPTGISMRDGIRLATTEINAAGGINGQQIQLVERDDEGKNERGAQIAQELINKEKVVAGIGIINTGVALASQRFWQEAKIPFMTASSTGSLITKQFVPPQYADNYIFRLSAYDSIQAEMIVQEAIDHRKLTKVAIIADSTNYGQLGREDLEHQLQKRGIKAVTVEKFNLKDVDMTPQLLRAKNAGAQALLLYGIGPELAHIANGMMKLSWKVPMIGSWSLSMSFFIDNAGPNGEGAMMPMSFIQEGITPRRKAFIEGYQKTYKMERIPSPMAAAQGYDSMLLLAAGLRQANSADGVKIREAMESLKDKVDGVITTYNRPFSHDEHEALKAKDAVMGVVKGGKVVFAYDEDKTRIAAQK